MSEAIMRKAFDTWRQFTKDKQEEEVREGLFFDNDFITDVVKDSKNNILETLEEMYKKNCQLNNYSVSNVLIEETINKFKDAYKYIDTVISDIRDTEQTILKDMKII